MQRIVVLTRTPESYSARRFVEAASRRKGVALELVDPHKLYLGLSGGAADVSLHGAAGATWDHSIARLGSTATEYALFALAHLEQAGTASLNTHGALSRLRYKFGTLAELAAGGVPVPDTMMLRAPNDIGAAVARLGGYPVVLKFIRGSQGVGVVYCDNLSVAESVLEALNLIQYDVMLQRFYPKAAEGDVRMLVLGGEARWAVRRTAPGGGFRANFHRGAQVSVYALAEEVAQLAVRAAGVFGLGFAGVDLAEDGGGGWIVLEVNGSPGFEAVEQVHGQVVAEAVLEHLLARNSG